MVPSLYFIKVHLTQYNGEIWQVGSMRLRVARLAYGQCSVTVARLNVLSAWEFALETDQMSLISVMGGGKSKRLFDFSHVKTDMNTTDEGKATAWKYNKTRLICKPSHCIIFNQHWLKPLFLSLWSRNNNHLRVFDFGFNQKWLPLLECSLTNHNAFNQSHPIHAHAPGSKRRDANVASCINWSGDSTQQETMPLNLSCWFFQSSLFLTTQGW